MFTTLAFLAAASIFVDMTCGAPVGQRALPTPISVATAKTYLSELTVAVDSNSPAYARDLFKTWDTSELRLCFLVLRESRSLNPRSFIQSQANVIQEKVGIFHFRSSSRTLILIRISKLF